MADMRGEDMDFGDAGWWGLVLAAIAGFLGWRVKSAQDSVQLAMLVNSVDKLNVRLASLENKLPAAAIQQERVDGIIRTLERHERAIERKVDR